MIVITMIMMVRCRCWCNHYHHHYYKHQQHHCSSSVKARPLLVVRIWWGISILQQLLLPVLLPVASLAAAAAAFMTTTVHQTDHYRPHRIIHHHDNNHHGSTGSIRYHQPPRVNAETTDFTNYCGSFHNNNTANDNKNNNNKNTYVAESRHHDNHHYHQNPTNRVVKDDSLSYIDDDDCHDALRRSILTTTVVSFVVAAGATPFTSHAASLPVPSTTSTSIAPILPPQQTSLIPNPVRNDDLYWPLGKVAFSLLPLAGTSTRRATVEETIVPHVMWTHDQIQGIVNVNVPIRQTVIRLSPKCGGGLWVHNPVAPTPQLQRMMDRLVRQYGPVRHIVLGTVALEHKATLPAFASLYPRATVWIQPGQWSFPIHLPIEYYGLQRQLLAHRLLELPNLSSTTTNKNNNNGNRRRRKYTAWDHPMAPPEWYHDIDYEILGPFSFRAVGGYSETAFYHRDTSTLLVTDCVVSVTNDPPAIVQEDPRALLYHSRDTANEAIDADTTERRRKGWRRMVQFGLVFFPSQITVTPTLGQVLDDIQRVPTNLRNLGTDAIPFNSALYPWSWSSNDADQINFNALTRNGTLFCPPILTKLILDREPTATLAFVDRVCQRFPNMTRVIPGHLNNQVAVTNAQEFYDAFDSLRVETSTLERSPPQRGALAEDLALLQKASDVLTNYRIIAPSLVCDGEPARRVGRFASAPI